MIAYRIVQPQQPPQFQETAKPPAGSGHLLIKVGGYGLCHTDLGLMRRTQAEWSDTPPPFTLGHEVAGWVAEIGQGVVGFKTGEPVAVLPLWGSCYVLKDFRRQVYCRGSAGDGEPGVAGAAAER